MNSNITQVIGQPNATPVIIFNETTPEKTINFRATNNLNFPIFVKIYFDQIENLQPTDSILGNSAWVQVSANSASQLIFSLTPIKENKGFSYRYRYQWLRRHPATSPRNDRRVRHWDWLCHDAEPQTDLQEILE